LTSKRPYRDRMNFYQVFGIINDGSGEDFDEFFVAALKKIKLHRLLLILEDEHRDQLLKKDLNFLSAFSLTDLLMCRSMESMSEKQQLLLDVFTKYYTRQYLKEG
jgi:hypothetical protein